MARTITRAECARLARVSKPAITKWLAKHPAARAGERVNLDHPDVVAYLKEKGHEVTPAPPEAPLPSADSDATPPVSPKGPRPKPAAPPVPAKASKRKPSEPTAPPPTRPDPGAPAAPGAGAPAKGKRARPPKRDSAPTPDAQGFVDELEDLTLIQICARYGTVSAYKAHLEAFEKRERALKYRLENEEAEGRLIERELVARVISSFDGANRKLLSDGPKTISRRLYAMARAEHTIEEAEATVHEIISSILKAVKKAVREVVDGA